MKSVEKQSSVRVIAGTWRSRVISFPLVEDLRPTSNRVRETLFNWLQNRVKGEDCLDLFAGSGACGIEALSRGARSVHFIERNRQVAQSIEQNLSLLKASPIVVHTADVIKWLSNTNRNDESKYGLVFIDPPYHDNLELTCCKLLEESGNLKPTALIYLESDKTISAGDLPKNWTIEKAKRAGSVKFYLFSRVALTGKISDEQ
jgi:16S rRNA (guanine966-N2)-methyltransferase